MRHLLPFLTLIIFALPAGAQQRYVFDDPAYEVSRFTPEAGPLFTLPRFVRLATIAVEINGAVLSRTHFSIDTDLPALRIEPGVLDTTHSLRVAYRVIPLDLTAGASLIDTTRASIQTERGPVERRAGGVDAIPTSDSPAVQSRGSISRGVTAGSNRDVGLESGLRVELSGEVAPGVAIRALLNDENTPLLPDGTTRRLEDFDRVFIELTSPVGEAQLGDISFRMQQSEFARLTRNLQGAAVRSRIGEATDAVGVHLVAAGAISRGQFRSLELPLIDGVRGPYRLTGSDGERLILVVPGSERVYWDGLLLERGDQQDYVIDYATGEITFTARRLVTDERRVLVEFEYSTNQFTRTLVASQAEVHAFAGRNGPRLRLGGGVIREADGSQFLDEFGLSREDSLALAQAGDSRAVRSGAEKVIFDPEAPYVHYVIREVTTPNERPDSAFVALTFRPDEGEPVYRVRFSHVGSGEGSYERGGEGVHGIVHRYVGPGLGAYDPVRVLPRPMAQQLFDVYGTVAIVPQVEVFGEWAHSYFDRNTLSLLDESDDAGNAHLAGVRLTPVEIIDGITMSGEVRRRQVGATFSAFDRIRPVEFERHWNLGTGVTPVQTEARFEREETVDEAQMRLGISDSGEIRLEGGRLRLGDTFEGRRFGGFISQRPGTWPGIEYRFEQIDSRDFALGRDGEWFRQRGVLQHNVRPIGATPFLEVEHENRRMRSMETDSLSLDSFRYVRLMPGLRWVHDGIGAGEASVSLRRDAESMHGLLYPSARSVTASLANAFSPSSRLSAEVRLGFRHRSYEESFRAIGRADQSSLLVNGHLRWRPHLQGIELVSSYDASGERTPLLQEVFVRVGPEYGQYVWEDLNGDGIIQPDEMIPERSPNEGVYARTFIPSDSLIATTTVQARLHLRVDPSTFWRQEEGWKGFAANISSRSTLDVLETTRDTDLTQIYLLHLTRYRDPVNTVNGRLRVGQEFTLFPRSRRGTIDLGFNQTATLSSRTGGRDERLIRIWRVDARYRPSSGFTLRNEVGAERNRQESEAFATRRFDITALRLEPEVSMRVVRDIQFVLRAPMAWKEDRVGGRAATLLRAPLELRYQRPGRASLSTRAEVAHVALTGLAVGLAEFELTDGRGPGTSYLWGVSGQYQLNEYLRATLNYDGRLPDGRPAIHTMRMQLSAVF